MLMEERFVAPGERLATEEEFAASDNTYAEDGIVYAATAGMAAAKDGTVVVSALLLRALMCLCIVSSYVS